MSHNKYNEHRHSALTATSALVLLFLLVTRLDSLCLNGFFHQRFAGATWEQAFTYARTETPRFWADTRDSDGWYRLSHDIVFGPGNWSGDARGPLFDGASGPSFNFFGSSQAQPSIRSVPAIQSLIVHDSYAPRHKAK